MPNTCINLYNGGIQVPPSTPNTDPDWSSVIFAMSGNDLLDARGNKINNIGPIAVDTGHPKFGTASIAFPNDPAKYLVLDPLASLRFTGDFTIEAWVYMNTISGVQPFFCFEDQNMLMQLQGGAIVWYVNGIASGWAGNAFPAFAVDGWTHLACERYLNICRAFVNGTAVGSTPAHAEALGSATSRLMIGRNTSPVGLSGNLADIRISLEGRYKGQAFTPPTAQFANH